jgi:molybdopterin converting factor small subunit
MAITVELTYDMSKALGVSSFELDDVGVVKDVIARTRERFGESSADFETLSKVAAVAVNGILVNHRKGMKTKLSPGDRVAFVKAAAGG